MLLAEVPRGLYVHRTSGGRYYLRVGSTRRDLTPPELARLFQQRGRENVFDEQPVLAATVDHLNRHRLEAFFGRSPTIPWLDLLRNTRVTLRDEGGVDRPTVAGLLTFGTEPTEFLASGSIEAACYSGERLSSDDLVHAETSQGLNHAVNTMPPARRAMLRADAGNHASSRPAPPLDCAERACTPRRPAALASMPMG